MRNMELLLKLVLQTVKIFNNIVFRDKTKGSGTGNVPYGPTSQLLLNSIELLPFLHDHK